MPKKAGREEEEEEEREEEEDPPPRRSKGKKRPKVCPSCDGRLDAAGFCATCDSEFDDEGSGRPAGYGARLKALEEKVEPLAGLSKLADTLSQGFLGKPSAEVTEEDVQGLKSGGGGGIGGLLSNTLGALASLGKKGKKGAAEE